MTLPTVPDPVNNLRPELRDHALATRDGMNTARVWVGRRLVEAKSLTRHGEWQAYLAVLGIKIHTAQRMMRAAEAIDSGQVPEGTSVTAALRQVAQPRAPANAAHVSHLEAEENPCSVCGCFAGTLKEQWRAWGAGKGPDPLLCPPRHARLMRFYAEHDPQRLKAFPPLYRD